MPCTPPVSGSRWPDLRICGVADREREGREREVEALEAQRREAEQEARAEADQSRDRQGPVIGESPTWRIMIAAI